MSASPGSDRLALRMPEVAARLGVHKATVQRWVASGQMPHVRIRGVVLVRLTDLDAFLEAHAEPARTTPRRR